MEQREESELHEAPELNRALKILETESDRNEETERRKTDVLFIAECLGQFI